MTATPDQMLEDPALAMVYNRRLLDLAAGAELPQRLEGPPCGARAVSPICGSEITVDLALDAEGRVTAFGFDVKACALTKSVVSVMREAIVGKTRADIAAAGKDLEDMLDGKDVRPAGDWAALEILAPVRDYPARHNSILLPFEAVEKAFAQGT
jgi:NifU-like protein involved in Fe-S cluster formation